MSPTQFHAKRDDVVANGLCPPPLKINKDSHCIKKSSPPSSSSSSSSSSTLAAAASKPPQQQQRHPVIIYTHSPKVIHTHPRDFMALVQKLTGLTRSDEDAAAAEQANPSSEEEENKGGGRGGGGKVAVGNNDDNDASSVITDEICSTSAAGGGDAAVVVVGHHQHQRQYHQANSSACFVQAPSRGTNNPYVTAGGSNVPVFAQQGYSPAVSEHHGFLCSNNQPAFYNYNPDSLFFAAPNVLPAASAVSSSSTFQGINDFPTTDF